VVRASVSALPFADGRFDLVTAVETQYFWPDLVNDMKEIRRVLKPGGTLVVIAEAYKGEGDSKPHSVLLKCLGSGYLSVREHQELLAKAGYIDAQVCEERTRRWICVMGRNPEF
jgi:ubiquinone/menaquinone biosynthesis C-methylase UbiE